MMDEKVLEILTPLTEKLGVTVEHLWGVLLAQARVSMVMDIFGLIFCIGVVVITVIYHIKFKKENEEGLSLYDLKEYPDFVICLMGLLSIFSIVGIIIGSEGILTKYFNPEFYALKTILQFLKIPF